MAQEYEMAEDEAQSWEDHLQKELHSLLMEHTPGKGSSLVKGHGKGSGKKGGKGKTKSKAKTRDTPALEDMPPEEQMGEGLKKLKRTKELLTQTYSNYEEALEKVKKLKYLTKPALKEKEKQLEQLETTLGKVKKLLAKETGIIWMVSRKPWKMQWQHCRKPKMKQRNWCRSAWRHNPKLQNSEELQKEPCKRAGKEYLCKRELKVQPKGSPLKNGWWVCENTYAKPQKETTLARGDTFFMAEPSLFFNWSCTVGFKHSEP